MAKDQQGLALAGSSASAEAFDHAVADYFGLTGDPVGALKTALASDPAFALGGVAIADLFMIGGFRGDHPEVSGALAAADAAIGGASSREKLHLAAAKALSAGRASDALLDLGGHSERLADRRAGAAPCPGRLLLSRPTACDARFGRACAAGLGPRQPADSFVLGTYAFGLEETNELGRAEDAARDALARNPR